LPHRMVVAMDDRRGQLPLPELVTLRFEGVKIQDATSFLEDLGQRVPVRSVRPGDLLFSAGFDFNRVRFGIKTVIEWLIALIALPFCGVLIALAGAAILLETGRPIFFRQARVGLGGRTFRLFKLRTMYQDAEKSGPRFAVAGDTRITRLGRFLRRTRIDELPQLFNVLRGEMALVGPRPERPEFVESFNDLIPYFNYRHSVRPGVTGWAQVSYGYVDDANGSLEKLSYDLFYIKHHTLMFDLQILLRTVKTVLGGEGR
jgi:exopolysaccharide biosynthesis polyprenyl glycosylphosphotransferase